MAPMNLTSKLLFLLTWYTHLPLGWYVLAGIIINLPAYILLYTLGVPSIVRFLVCFGFGWWQGNLWLGPRGNKSPWQPSILLLTRGHIPHTIY